MTDAGAAPLDTASPRSRSPADDFIFVDAHWQLRQSYRQDILQPQFFAALREKRLLGVRDPSNGRVLFPPRSFSEAGFCIMSELVAVGPGGIIRTLTRLPGGGPNNRPAVLLAFVQFDGADSAGAGTLRGAGTDLARPSDLIGRRCRAVFKDNPAGDWHDYWFELDGDRS